MTMEKMRAVNIVAKYGSFDGTVEDWREAYFKLISWKNTWEVPYKMDICSTGDHEAFLRLVVPEDRKEQVLEMLDGYGYKDVKCHDDFIVAVIELKYDEDIDEYVVEY